MGTEPYGTGVEPYGMGFEPYGIGALKKFKQGGRCADPAPTERLYDYWFAVERKIIIVIGE